VNPRCSLQHKPDPPTGDSATRRGCLACYEARMAGHGMRSGSERFLRISDLRVKTDLQTQRVGMRASISGTGPRRRSPLAAPGGLPDSQQERPARPPSTSATARSNTLSWGRLRLASVVERTMIGRPPDTVRCGQKRPDSDRFLAGFGHMGHLRAKPAFEPEVLSRRTFFRKDKFARFREAQDDVSGR
jgi:hypothetical protein